MVKSCLPRGDLPSVGIRVPHGAVPSLFRPPSPTRGSCALIQIPLSAVIVPDAIASSRA